mmetsp:Transcript_28113/g.70610  ORF Transcript_28113/g.70610 Transcript_28113/m.70610 type:complete len:378 (-) Transcript_28113:627-1760(-)
MLLAEVGVRHVAHHDVAATEANLTLLLLCQVLLPRPARLHLDVLAVGACLEALHLDARERVAHSAEHVLSGRADCCEAPALAHAVDILDHHAQLPEVLEGLDGDRRRARDEDLTLIQAQRVPGLREDQLVRDAVEEGLSARAAKLQVAGVLEALALGPGREGLLDAGDGGADGHHAGLHLLEDAGHGEEGRGAAELDAHGEGHLLQVIWARKVNACRHFVRAGEEDGVQDIHQSASDVGQGEVGQDPRALAALPSLEQTDVWVHEHRPLRNDRVMVDHDSLWVPCCSRGIDDAHAMPRLLGLHHCVQRLVRAFCIAELHEAVPSHHAANTAVAAPQVAGSGDAPANDCLQIRHLLNLGGGCLVLDLSVDADDGGSRV